MDLMKIYLLMCLAVLAGAAGRVQASDACLAAYDKAGQDKVAVAGVVTERKVAGPGRLYFHTAPDNRCRTKDIFVVPNDRLAVYAEYGVFAEVIYWDPVTGAGTAGWVPVSRLADNEKLASMAN